MIVLTAKYFVKAGRGDEVAAALRRMAPLVKSSEPGCALYHANRAAENPDMFLLYEQYTDQAALDAHRNTPHFKEIIEGTIVPLLDKREREFYPPVVTEDPRGFAPRTPLHALSRAASSARSVRVAHSLRSFAPFMR